MSHPRSSSPPLSSWTRRNNTALTTLQIPKQLHISPLSPPRYPRYFLGPYLNIKQAVQTVLSEEYRRAEYARTHPDNPPNKRAPSRIGTGRYLSRAEREGGKGPKFYGTIPQMLEMLQLGEFEGRRHSGLDVSGLKLALGQQINLLLRERDYGPLIRIQDAGNVARILIALAEKNVLVEPNGRLHHHKNARKWPWMGEPGVVVWEEWMRGVGPAGDKGGKAGEGSQDKDKAGDKQKEGTGLVQLKKDEGEGEEVVGTLRENGEGTSSSGDSESGEGDSDGNGGVEGDVKQRGADTGDGSGVDTPALESRVDGKAISETSETVKDVSQDQADQSPTTRHAGSDGVVGGSDKENETPRGSSGPSGHRPGAVEGFREQGQDHEHAVDGAK